VLYRAAEATQDAVVLEQVSQRGGVGQVVQSDYVEVGSGNPRRAEEVAPDAPEPIDSHPNCHDQSPLFSSAEDPPDLSKPYRSDIRETAPGKRQ
jgi:hypothetical protein